MVELIILRHAQTTRDTTYVKDSPTEGAPYKESEGPILKGHSNDIAYRLSDLGVLQAYTTAERIRRHYEGLGKLGKVVLCNSPLLRATETEEILKLVIHEAVCADIGELTERNFGGIEGHKIVDLNNALKDTKMYPSLDLALTYSDNFDYLEEALKIRGLKVEHRDSEDFKSTLRTRHRGLRYILENYSWADCIIAVVHQISGVFTIGAVDLLDKKEEDVERILSGIDVSSYYAKKKIVPYSHLEPSRFSRIRITEFEGTMWVEYIEQNESGHLTSLQHKRILDPKDRELVDRIRASLVHLYSSRGLPLGPDRSTPADGFPVADPTKFDPAHPFRPESNGQNK